MFRERQMKDYRKYQRGEQLQQHNHKDLQWKASLKE